jgi:DNA repair photolyase
MSEKQICAKSILRPRRRIDSWFISRYGLNLYRGCAHGCAYCDGRYEHYQAPENFAEDIEVKANALALLDAEFARIARKNTPGKQLDLFSEEPAPAPFSGFITLGGGVSDQYQPIEKKYALARGVLELCLRYHFPVHILTKSTLLLRDTDLLRAINEETRALVSVSISTVDPALAAITEPGASPPEERLAMIRELSAAGIAGGVFLLPVLPFLSDSPAAIEASVAGAARAGARYVLFGGLTLKRGRQADYYLNCLDKNFPEAAKATRELFRKTNGQGWPDTLEGMERWQGICETARRAIARHGVAGAIPLEIFKSVVSGADKESILARQKTQQFGW